MMTTAQGALASAAYALFALEQPIALAEISAAAPAGIFPMAATQTPGWFAAAASDTSSLLDTAPELQVRPDDGDEDGRLDVTGLDLIHVFAPELRAVEEVPEPATVEKVAPPARVVPVEKPRTSTQIGLLKELFDLDT
jgi:hypothetical protein